jgi:hypothetical protein
MKKTILAAVVLLMIFASTSYASDRNAVWYSVVFPGWGQFKTGRYKRGTALLGLQIISLSALLMSDIQYDRKVDQYNSYKSLYDGADYIGDAQKYYNAMNEAWDDAENLDKYRQIFLGTSITIWAVGIVDMLIGPEGSAPPLALTVGDGAFYVTRTISF